jgi:hypothetical protein
MHVHLAALHRQEHVAAAAEADDQVAGLHEVGRRLHSTGHRGRPRVDHPHVADTAEEFETIVAGA